MLTVNEAMKSCLAHNQHTFHTLFCTHVRQVPLSDLRFSTSFSCLQDNGSHALHFCLSPCVKRGDCISFDQSCTERLFSFEPRTASLARGIISCSYVLLSARLILIAMPSTLTDTY